MKSKNYITQLNRLATKEYTGAKLGLGRVRKALRELGNPHHNYQTIHIAGTNGKGSTAALIYHVLMAAGFKVGFYTSPHFLDYRERIRVNERLIPHEQLRQALTATFTTQIGAELTYFEVLTVAAFKYFADANIDILVCEVGLGGRLDATNVIKKPLVSVITSIDYDHQEFLGNSLAQIAQEKAGIIKRGTPVVAYTGHAAADRVIQQKCVTLKSPCYFLKQDFRPKKSRMDWENKEQIFSYCGIKNNYCDLHLSLLGAHQIRNASLALAAIELIGTKRNGNYAVSEEALRHGLESARWVGRIDIREEIIFPEYPSIPRTIILDGAHNAAGAKVLRATLATSPYVKNDTNKSKGRANFVIIMSVLRDKNYRKICQELRYIATKVITFTAHSERALDSKILQKEWLKYLPKNKVFAAQNLNAAMQLLSKNDKVICVTGSLYGISEILEKLRKLKTN